MDIDKLKKAGRIVAQVRRETLEKCKEGIKLLDLMDFAEKRVIELEGEVAWAQVSPNEIAAHFCPTEQDNPKIKKGDLITIDLGVHVDGNIADTAATIEIGTEKYKSMIEASSNALEEALKLAKPGIKLWELGEAQENEAKKKGFNIVKNLSGHSLGLYKVHAGITIPSFNNNNIDTLEEGMVIAIEPFVTEGEGFIHEKGDPTVFMQESNKSTRSMYGRKILPYIREKKGLPFSQKEIERKFGNVIGRVGLRDLIKDNILKPYPPLVEKKPVAQMEHTVIVAHQPIVITR